MTQLDKTDHMGRHELILATSEEEMRGVDLRAPTKGVKLVIAKSFSCQRNADQGLMRVGRYGDPCERLICSYVDLVDDEQAGALNKRLFAFAKAHQPKVKPKAGPFVDGEYYSKMAQKQEDKIKQQRAKPPQPGASQQQLPFKPQEQGGMPTDTSGDGTKVEPAGPTE